MAVTLINLVDNDNDNDSVRFESSYRQFEREISWKIPSVISAAGIAVALFGALITVFSELYGFGPTKFIGVVVAGSGIGMVIGAALLFILFHLIIGVEHVWSKFFA